MRETVKVRVGVLNLRAQPNDHSAVLASLPQGTVVHIDRREGNWLHTTYNGKSGYLYKRYVDVMPAKKPMHKSYWTLAAVAVAVISAVVVALFLIGWQ